MSDDLPSASAETVKEAATTVRDIQPEVILFSRYRVVRELGRGGMGVVLLAHDNVLGIDVALKLLPELIVNDAEAIAELRAEVLRGIALAHPGIVRVFTFEKDATHAAIVMEYVDGASLADLRLRQPDGCFDANALLPWVEQLCAALDYAHTEAKLVHRDLKPRNLMVGSGGRLKVADFGIAANLSDTLSRATQAPRGSTSGTPAYMSPQQALGGRPSVRDDIYALGATLYELLTGKPPFFRGNILAQVQQEIPPLIAQRRAERGLAGRKPVPPAWEETIAACLAKNPDDRPASAGAVRARLEGEAKLPLAAPGAPRRRFALAAGIAALLVIAAAAWLIETTFHKPHPIAATSAPPPSPAASGTPAASTPPPPITIPKVIEGPLTILAPATPKPVYAPIEVHKIGRAPAGSQPRAGKPWANSLAMKFVPIPKTGVLCAVWETRVADYAAFVEASQHPWERPPFAQDGTHPVVNMTWDDANAFCHWLTEIEQQNGWLSGSQRYRLPSDHEWSCAAGIGDRESAAASPKQRQFSTAIDYAWGRQWPPPKGAGNFADESLHALKTVHPYSWIKGYDDEYAYTAPVGSFPPNRLGIYDLAGNAGEWCDDWFDETRERRVVRGGSWQSSNQLDLAIADRVDLSSTPWKSGFRCVVELDAKR